MTVLAPEHHAAHPNAIAERISGRDYISLSAIGTYAACPLRYFFRYVQGLPEQTVSSSLVFGSGIHAGIEHHFNELMAGNPAPDHDTLLSVFWDCWRDREAGSAISYSTGEDVSSIGRLADRVLAAFRDSELAKPHGTMLGVEEELRGEVASRAGFAGPHRPAGRNRRGAAGHGLQDGPQPGGLASMALLAPVPANDLWIRKR